MLFLWISLNTKLILERKKFKKTKRRSLLCSINKDVLFTKHNRIKRKREGKAKSFFTIMFSEQNRHGFDHWKEQVCFKLTKMKEKTRKEKKNRTVLFNRTELFCFLWSVPFNKQNKLVSKKQKKKGKEGRKEHSIIVNWLYVSSLLVSSRIYLILSVFLSKQSNCIWRNISIILKTMYRFRKPYFFDKLVIFYLKYCIQKHLSHFAYVGSIQLFT